MAYIYFEAPGASPMKPPNSEILVKNFVVEKLYRQHRRQVLSSHHVVDDRLECPERLMKKNPYKVLMQKVEAKKIENDNHEIYLRMSKIEASTSDYVNDQIRHHELVTPMKFHFDRLNKLDRVRRIHATNNSNLAMLARLNRVRARPEVSIKETEKWYRKHLHFKSARRQNHTGGHLMRGMKGLLPGKLPPPSFCGDEVDKSPVRESSVNEKRSRPQTAPLRAAASKEVKESVSNVIQMPTKSPSSLLRSESAPMRRRPDADIQPRPVDGNRKEIQAFGSHVDEIASKPKNKPSRPRTAIAIARERDRLEARNRGLSAAPSLSASAATSKVGQQSDLHHGSSLVTSSLQVGMEESDHRTPLDSLYMWDGFQASVLSSTVVKEKRHLGISPIVSKRGSLRGSFLSVQSKTRSRRDHTSADSSVADEEIDRVCDADEESLASDIKYELIAERRLESGEVVSAEIENDLASSSIESAPPTETAIQAIYNRRRPMSVYLRLVLRPSKVVNQTIPDDNPVETEETIKLIDPTEDFVILAEREVPMEDVKLMAFGSLDLDHSEPLDIIKDFTDDPTKSVDLVTTRAAIIGIFGICDVSGDGHISSDEFFPHLGLFDEKFANYISHCTNHDISELMRELDKDNGIIDYDEYVNFAVDLMQALRARRVASNIEAKRRRNLDALVEETIITQQPWLLAQVCMEEFCEADPQNIGLIRVRDFMNCLRSRRNEISDYENSRIRKLIPRDNFGRIQYATFPDILYKVRRSALRREQLEISTNKLERQLLAHLKETEEAEFIPSKARQITNFVHTGYLNFRVLTKALVTCKFLELSFLQTSVLTSWCDLSEMDGLIDYYEFVPMFVAGYEELIDYVNVQQRWDMVRASTLNFNIDEIARSYSTRELSMIAEFLFDAVRLETGAIKGAAARLILPADDSRVLASRPQVRIITESGKMSSSTQRVCNLEVMYSSSYAPDTFVIRAMRIGESKLQSTKTAGKPNLSPLLAERVVDIVDMKAHLPSSMRRELNSEIKPAAAPSTTTTTTSTEADTSRLDPEYSLDRDHEADPVTPNELPHIAEFILGKLSIVSVHIGGFMEDGVRRADNEMIAIVIPGETTEDALNWAAIGPVVSMADHTSLSPPDALLQKTKTLHRNWSLGSTNSFHSGPLDSPSKRAAEQVRDVTSVFIRKCAQIKIVVRQPPHRGKTFRLSGRVSVVMTPLGASYVPSSRLDPASLGVSDLVQSLSCIKNTKDGLQFDPRYWHVLLSLRVVRAVHRNHDKNNHVGTPDGKGSLTPVREVTGDGKLTSTAILAREATKALVDAPPKQGPKAGHNFDLVISVLSMNSSFAIRDLVYPVSFPSIAICDAEAAEDFCENILERLYIEVPHDWKGNNSGVQLVVQDDTS